MLRPLAVAVAALLLSSAARAATLTVSVEKEPGDVHPTRSLTLEAVLIANQVYEPLVAMGPSGEIEPVLLESWSYVPEKRTLVCALRKGVKFSDGVVLTSRHVADWVKRIIAEKRLKNFQRIKKLTIRGPEAFSLEFDAPYPRFLSDLAKLADPYSSVFRDAAGSALPLGTGPYLFREADPAARKVVLALNPHAAGPKPGFDSVVFTADRAEDAGLYLGEPAGPAARLRKTEYLDTEVVFLGFNAANPALADARARRFLGSLLSEKTVDEVLGPAPYKIGGFIPYGLPGHDPALSFKGAPRPARLPGSVTVSIYLPRLESLAERYCAALKENGVGCAVRVRTTAEMAAARKDGSLQLFLMRQKSTTYSVEHLLSGFTSGNISNYFTAGAADAALIRRMDSLFGRILETPPEDKTSLLALYREMDAAVLDAALARPIRYGVNKALWYDRKLVLPPLDTLGPYGLKLRDVKLHE